MRRYQGFTLIEVMIVVAIIAILASVAIPAYSEYVKRSHITEAVSGLSDMRVKLEQYFQDNRKYTGACADGTVAPVPDKPNFTFTCTLADTTYTVTATGKSTSTMNGFIYTVDQSNVRKTTGLPGGWSGSGDTSTCWVIKKDGTCA